MKKNELPSIGERIAFVRGELTQAEFALKLGANRMTVSRYERGEREPNSGFLCLLIEKFGVDANWLLLGTGDVPTPPPSAEIITQKSNEPCVKCARLEAELFEERSLNRELVLESKEQSKEIRELNKENRQLTKDNRELVRENRDLGKENMKLVRQLASHAEDRLPPKAKRKKPIIQYAMPSGNLFGEEEQEKQE